MSPFSRTEHLDEKALDHARKDFVQLSVDETVATALEQVRQHKPTGRIIYFYVVDQEGQLVGVLPTRRLLLNSPEATVSSIMVPNVVMLPESATLLDACEYFIMHRFLALPIVDEKKRLLGVVDVELYTDEISDLIRQEESEDIFQLIGVRLALVQKASLGVVFLNRFPWLLCNILGGLACAVLAARFEGILNQVIVLSLFIPVVLAVAESVSIQTLSLALQSRHGNRFRWGETFREFAREIPVGLMLGGVCGLLVAGVVIVWKQMALVALVILLSMGLAVTTAATLGLLIPTLLHTAQRDPKVASGPIVLALTDLAALFYYLGFATLLLA
jgi:magnesium transporter